MAEAGAVAARTAVARDAATGSEAAAPYVAQFRRLYRELKAGLGVDDAVLAERAAALEELEATGFPVRHDEAWSHTPLQAVVGPKSQYRLGTAEPAHAPGGWASEELSSLLSGEPVILLTMNGHSANTNVSPPVDSRLGVIRTAWNGAFGRTATFTRPIGDAFTRLSRIFGSCDELRLDAAAGDAPLHLVHLTEAGVLGTARVRIRIADGARVTLVETFAAANGGAPDAAPCPGLRRHRDPSRRRGGADLRAGAGGGGGLLRPGQHHGGAGARQRAARPERGGRRPTGAPYPQPAGRGTRHHQPPRRGGGSRGAVRRR